MKKQCGFWFVHAKAKNGHEAVNVAVAAFTERSARMQARRCIGAGFYIKEANPICYAHAWVMNHTWFAAPAPEER